MLELLSPERGLRRKLKIFLVDMNRFFIGFERFDIQ